MFFDFKQLLFLEMVNPAKEKTLSAAVDVAGIHNIDLASLILGFIHFPPFENINTAGRWFSLLYLRH